MIYFRELFRALNLYFECVQRFFFVFLRRCGIYIVYLKFEYLDTPLFFAFVMRKGNDTSFYSESFFIEQGIFGKFFFGV